MAQGAIMGPGRGVLRVVSPEDLISQEANQNAAAVAAQDELARQDAWSTNLNSFIEGEFSRFQRHRDGANGWTDRITAAMRTFKGEYNPTQLAEIQKFGGSTVYARVIATKCRGASSLLRDVYLNTEKPWGLEPTPDPTLPDDILGQIDQLVQVELQSMQSMGQPVDPAQIKDRVMGLVASAKRAAIKKARLEAEQAQLKLDDILVEGHFYEALAQFLVDLPLFPFACIKGPVVRIVPVVTWVNGVAKLENKPKMFWYRVSPYDIWWTPGVSAIQDAAVIERTRLSRHDLNQLVGLPGYNEDAIRQVLIEYGRGGLVQALSDTSDTTRAQMESRENPRMNESGLIDMLEYHGYVQGKMLLEQGVPEDQVPDPDLDYFVDAFKIGRYVIKVQLSPSIRKRPPYYVTSFEKVPGTVVGNGLPDILADIQDVSNAALRALVNNMAIASGPQCVVNDDRLGDNEDGDEMYPWKRWHVQNDPMGNNTVAPISFFNPESHSQELLVVYEKFTQIADDLSAIPRYVTGSERLGGAGRTASGLAMLMGNAAKILQTVAANIDNDVIEPSVGELYDMIMLTDTTGLLRGDESINVLGVNVAVQRETQRQRQLEFLQITGNPIDMQITGVRGRANVLRSVADGIGMGGVDVVPPDDEIAAKEKQAEMMGPPPGAPGAPPGPPGASPPGGGPAAPPPPQAPAPQAIQGPQTNVVGPSQG
jgi:hypothetical protein